MNVHSRINKKGRAAYLASLDIHIGQRMRMQRKAWGLSQKALGKLLGVTFQQIGKYENGTDSLSSRRLYQLALIFHVPLAFFFDGYGDIRLLDGPIRGGESLNLSLIRACGKIRTPAIKTASLNLIQAIAETEETAPSRATSAGISGERA